jgi:hypothetical protein
MWQSMSVKGIDVQKGVSFQCHCMVVLHVIAKALWQVLPPSFDRIASLTHKIVEDNRMNIVNIVGPQPFVFRTMGQERQPVIYLGNPTHTYCSTYIILHMQVEMSLVLCNRIASHETSFCLYSARLRIGGALPSLQHLESFTLLGFAASVTQNGRPTALRSARSVPPKTTEQFAVWKWTLVNRSHLRQ